MNLSHCQVDAVDPLLEKYEAKLAHFSSDHYPSTRFIAQPFEQFSTEKKYEIVFSINAINHVADLEQCLDKLVDLTAKNGILVMSIDAHNYLIFKHLFRLIPGDILHPHQYDLEEYKAMLRSRNMHISQSILLKKEFFFDYHVLVATKQ